MRTIAIVLGDNDYGNTFTHLLISIYNVLGRSGEMDREVVENLVREGVRYHYLAFQVGSRYGTPGAPDIDSTLQYLSNIRVYFDEEAEADIQQNDYDGGAWYLEVETGDVYPY